MPQLTQLYKCINEYLAIDSDENVSDLVVARNCCMARRMPSQRSRVGVGMNRSTGGGGVTCEAL